MEMAEFGFRMRRAQLRRAHPGADDATIDRLMNEWLLDRPGAVGGDCSGPVTVRLP